MLSIPGYRRMPIIIDVFYGLSGYWLKPTAKLPMRLKEVAAFR